MSGKNPPVLRTTGRRSARRRGGQGQDPVIAPGFGTSKDIEKLSHDLSVGSDATLPSAAVEGVYLVLFVDVCVCVCVCVLFCFVGLC